MRRALLSILESTRLAVETLGANRFRSFLTSLGVFIGVLLVVLVASVLNGFRQSVVDQVQQFGTDNVYVLHQPLFQLGRPSREMRLRKKLVLEDAWAVRDSCPSIDIMTPVLLGSRSIGSARYRGEEIVGPNLRGVYPIDVEVAHREIEAGRFFTEQENHHRADVVVLGSASAKALFPNGGAVGKEIEIDSRRYRVVGTLAPRKAGPFGTENANDGVFLVPYLTLQHNYLTADVVMLAIRCRTGQVEQVIDEVTQVLRRRRKVRWDEENDFEIQTSDSLIESFDGIVLAVMAVMFLLSTVGFLVGGVGVMNIMLVSVRERTREIGLRKAVGARRRDILGQFLVESVVLCAIGGVLALLVAEGLLMLVGQLVPEVVSRTPWWARVFAFAGSGGVGLFFGLWPAWRAASLDPVEALRYE